MIIKYQYKPVIHPNFDYEHILIVVWFGSLMLLIPISSYIFINKTETKIIEDLYSKNMIDYTIQIPLEGSSVHQYI